MPFERSRKNKKGLVQAVPSITTEMLNLLKEGDPLQTCSLCAFRCTKTHPLIRAGPLLLEADPLLSPMRKPKSVPMLSTNKTPL